jgi:hypothetical protein
LLFFLFILLILVANISNIGVTTFLAIVNLDPFLSPSSSSSPIHFPTLIVMCVLPLFKFEFEGPTLLTHELELLLTAN